MQYAHRIKVHRPSGAIPTPNDGTQDPGDGGWVPVDPDNNPATDETLVFDAICDVQDMGRALNRNAEGVVVEMSDAEVYLADESLVRLAQEGDLAYIDWQDGSPIDDALVQKTTRLDGVLSVRFL